MYCKNSQGRNPFGHEARAEICQKIGWFLGDLKTPKIHSQIN